MLHIMHGLEEFLKRNMVKNSAFLLFYFFLHDKPKFLTLVMDKASQEDDASNKRSVRAKEEQPIGNKKCEKHMKNRRHS